MLRISESTSLLAHNTFAIDVNTHYWAEYDSIPDLISLLHRPEFQNIPMLHIGRGSNLLFTQDYPGVVLHSCIEGIRVLDETGTTVDVEVGSGVLWDDLCAWAVSHDYYGIENLSAIPGECGAAAVQNIGAYGSEIKDVLLQVKTLQVSDCTERVFSVAQCDYKYRYSIFKSDAMKGKYIVTHIVLRLGKTPVFNIEYGNLQKELQGVELTLANVRKVIIATRSSKLPDPAVMGNAGSFFKNPIITRQAFESLQAVYPFMPFYEVDAKRVKVPAAWLIEQCGWKGRVLGGASCYQKQPLVLVNYKHATAAEIVKLAESIIRTVKERFDITIEPEVNII